MRSVTLATHLIDTLVHMDVVGLDDTEKKQEKNKLNYDFLRFTPSIICWPSILVIFLMDSSLISIMSLRRGRRTMNHEGDA